jgi:hypothetical protein
MESQTDSRDQSEQVKGLLEQARRAEARIRAADIVLRLIGIAFFVGFIYGIWSCRDGCSSLSWFCLGLYPVVMVFYLVRRRQIGRQLESERAGRSDRPSFETAEPTVDPDQ